MASGLFVPVCATLPGHPKFKRLCKELDVDSVTGVGTLVLLWAWVVQYFHDGYLHNVTASEINDVCGWDIGNTEPGVLVEKLILCGFIEEIDGCFYVHSWDKYAGRLQRSRAKTKKRMRNMRERARNVTVTYANVHARAETKEKEKEKEKVDKEKEKEKEKKSKSSCSETQKRDSKLDEKNSGKPPLCKNSKLDPVIFTVGTNGKIKLWDFRESKLREYESLYPGMDVKHQVHKALQWIRDNPGNRKTAKGMPSFLTRWLGKANDSGRAPPKEANNETLGDRVLEGFEHRNPTQEDLDCALGGDDDDG